MIIGEARYRYTKILENRINLQLLWIPSHTGLLFRDTDDTLAKSINLKENVEYNFDLSVFTIRNNIRREVNNENECYKM